MDAYFNATYLAKDGAQIVINISYRLGILGWFLRNKIPKVKTLDAQYATQPLGQPAPIKKPRQGFVNGYDEEQERPIGGNYGLMDQQEALRFIHQNAEAGFQEFEH